MLSARRQAMHDFRDNKSTFLLATPAAARGLDLPAVSHIYNLSPPSDAVEYLHRAGRVGRIGANVPGGDLTRLACCAEACACCMYDRHHRLWPDTYSAVPCQLVHVLTCPYMQPVLTAGSMTWVCSYADASRQHCHVQRIVIGHASTLYCTCGQSKYSNPVQLDCAWWLLRLRNAAFHLLSSCSADQLDAD